MKVFGDCLAAFKLQTTRDMAEVSKHGQNENGSDNQQQEALSQALGALDEDAIYKVNADLKQIMLQYLDSAGRKHQMLVSLSWRDSQLRVSNCQADLPEKSLHQFPAPIHTVGSDHAESEPNRKRPKLEMEHEGAGGRNSGNHFSLQARPPFPFSTALSLLRQETSSGAGSGFTLKTELSACFQEFKNIVDNCQDLWNELDDLDSICCLSGMSSTPAKPSRSRTQRMLQISDAVRLLLTLNVSHPRQPPEAYHVVSTDKEAHYLYERRFLGNLEQSLWNDAVSVRKNLECCLGVSLQVTSAFSPTGRCDNESDMPEMEELNSAKECGVCYTTELEGEDTGLPGSYTELPSITCDNDCCNRTYHESCLQEWLESLPSSRVAFDTLLGECPYCQGPISTPLRE
jgi:hypothetical protein